MENSYGIGITNRYSCFLYSDDDTEEIRPQEEEKEKKKKGKTTEKENRSKEAAAETAPSQKTGSTNAARKGIRDSNQKGNDAVKSGNRTNNGNSTRPTGIDAGSKPNRGPRNERPAYDKDRGVKFTEEDREERNNRRNREDSGREARSDSGSEFGSRSGSRGGSGRGGFRGDRRGGPRGGRGGGSGGAGTGGGYRKREFDRQSGSEKSGVKPVDKRDGAGSRNWGTYKDDLEEISGGNQTGGEESSEDKPRDPEHSDDRLKFFLNASREAGEEKENQNDTPNGPTEEQPKLMTLDEWKALQQPREKPVFNLRKPGEGEDPSQWQKMILIKKEKEGEEEDDEEEEEEYDCPQRAGRQKQVLEIDFHFTDSRRGGNERRGGRGGRGGPSPRESSRGRGGGSAGSGGGGERGGTSTGGSGGGGGGGGSGTGGPGTGGGTGFKGTYRGGRGGRGDD